MSGCEKKQTLKYSTRQSPPYPANQCPEHDIKKGNDGQFWIVSKNVKGIHRWVRYKGSSGPTKPKPKHTINEIKSILEKRKVPFKKTAKKAELEKLLHASHPEQTHSKKWYHGLVSHNDLKKVIGFTAVTERDVTVQQVLDNFSSKQSYERAKRGEDPIAGWEIIGREDKMYLEHYPI